MDGSKCILQLRGVRPFFSDKYDITKHKNYRYLSDANPKNAFNVEKHINRRLRIKPDDEFEEFEHTPGSDDPQDELYDDDEYPEDLEPV
jgi:type IV secretion system protein VirD4